MNARSAEESSAFIIKNATIATQLKAGEDNQLLSKSKDIGQET